MPYGNFGDILMDFSYTSIDLCISQRHFSYTIRNNNTAHILDFPIYLHNLGACCKNPTHYSSVQSRRVGASLLASRATDQASSKNIPNHRRWLSAVEVRATVYKHFSSSATLNSKVYSLYLLHNIFLDGNARGRGEEAGRKEKRVMLN